VRSAYFPYTPSMRALTRFVVRECGQDLVEYTLLLAFASLGTAAVLMTSGLSINSVWTTAHSHLKKGHAYAYGQDHGTGNPHE
jgi:Flp pilus assembly pilin Flp